MKTLVLTTLLLLTSFSAYSKNEYTEPSFCEWLGNTATSVAQIRDNGVGEYDLIGKYLSEGKSYGEQSVVIPLIDRVYGVEKQLSPAKILFIEKQQCMLTLANYLP